VTATPISGDFCERCRAESSDESPGSISTINGVGRKFYGNKTPCPECGSAVRTLWYTFADIPLFPKGSYRYIPAEKGFMSSKFWARRTRTHWDQVFKIWIVGIIVAVALFAAIIWWDKRKGTL
jgi:hypothetical protein